MGKKKKEPQLRHRTLEDLMAEPRTTPRKRFSVARDMYYRQSSRFFRDEDLKDDEETKFRWIWLLDGLLSVLSATALSATASRLASDKKWLHSTKTLDLPLSQSPDSASLNETTIGPTTSQDPSTQPTATPSFRPSTQPSKHPSALPSFNPSALPSLSFAPSLSSAPSTLPTVTAEPTTSIQPSSEPSISSQPSHRPSVAPSTSIQPSFSPTPQPSPLPSILPLMTTLSPSTIPSMTNITSEDVKLYILAGDENILGYASYDQLQQLAAFGGPEFSGLIDSGGPIVRSDVFVSVKMENDDSGEMLEGNLSVEGFGAAGGRFGPEVGFGYRIEKSQYETIVILKAWGNGDFNEDWRPPSSGGEVGTLYSELVNDILDTIGRADDITAYETHLQNFIDDIRSDLQVPNLPIVIAELGAQGTSAIPIETEFREMQRRVALSNVQVLVAETSQYIDGFDINDRNEVTEGGTRYWGRADVMFRIGREFTDVMRKLEAMDSPMQVPVATPTRLPTTSPTPPPTPPLLPTDVLFTATFDSDEEDFTFQVDTFRSTNAASYAKGQRVTVDDRDGVLQVTLGGVEETPLNSGISGGWERRFTLDEAKDLSLSFRMQVSQTSGYSDLATSDGLLAVDGVLIGQLSFDYSIQLVGNGSPKSSFWKEFVVHLGELNAGRHVISLGGFVSEKPSQRTITKILIDDVTVFFTDPLQNDPSVDAQRVVNRLDLERFKDNIRILSSFGDREQGSISHQIGEAWMRSELESYGYKVEEHEYEYRGDSRRNLYATKEGLRFSDRAVLVSAHLDGSGGGGSADEGASGCSLLLEMARVFNIQDVDTDISVRFLVWNNGATEQAGSRAYMSDRASLQGIELPDDSGVYPEPTWLAVIQLDTILFDHGLPPSIDQSSSADVDIEFDGISVLAATSLDLANSFLVGNEAYSESYPAEIGSGMRGTDSSSFQNVVPSISIRENRLSELEQGSNPHLNEMTDIYSSYSERDFRFGFDIVRMTTGVVAELAGLKIQLIEI